VGVVGKEINSIPYEAQHFTVILKTKNYVFDGIFDIGLRSGIELIAQDKGATLSERPLSPC
jgi:hypothetical protein